MTKEPVSIPKHPVLKPIEDYYFLRREGIGYIEQMGSEHWTDYNLHDPGITLLEALCYALTDLGYRLGWDIKDLLTAPAGVASTPQAFFTAREILTINPWTQEDFRRLLIDLDGVGNAWLFCKHCACDLHYLAWCHDHALEIGYVIPADRVLALANAGKTATKVSPHGFYEVLLELEADPEVGDLNDRKIEITTQELIDNVYHPLTLELRFPDRHQLSAADYELLMTANPLSAISVTDILRSKNEATSIDAAQLKSNWRGVYYVTLRVDIIGGVHPVTLKQVPMRIYGNDKLKQSFAISTLKSILEDNSSKGLLESYRLKLRKSARAIEDAKTVLHAHRNLDEDFCSIKTVHIEDVAVCCDVDVTPDADIERVQAQIWFEIEQYLNPPIRFYSLQELMQADMPVEEIFEGPALDNGFIKSNELRTAKLKTEIRVSDIINRLMEIDGVIAINNILLTKYNDEGLPIAGAADLQGPHPNPKQTSANWTLAISPFHQPRLYYNLSRFLFFKNGLPFLPRMDEAKETLTQLQGESERPKVKFGENDLAVPKGQHRDPEQYYPVQYSLPLTYGVGIEGLPSHVSAMRRAQAKQFKAYLMPFEQILANALSQVNHISDLFSLDPAVQRSYFVRLLDDQVISGISQLYNNLGPNELYDLVETESIFLERRNRFLDHLMARFGEQYKEYALLLSNDKGKQLALRELIDDKISFLKDYPRISSHRAKAFNYSLQPNHPANVPGLRLRINKLLGTNPGAPEERFLIVEHLLLRPKFPGDALWPVCADGDCEMCGDEDPYSFRLTFVMPGWSSMYANNLEMRRFADRTIRQETPSHLLPKICWVGNRTYRPGPCDPIAREITAILESLPSFVSNAECTCAREIVDRFYQQFNLSFQQYKTGNVHVTESGWRKLLTSRFTAVSLTNMPCIPSGIPPVVDQAIRSRLLEYFIEVGVRSYQFARFETAWMEWLEVNARFDWTEERLHDRVESILKNTLEPQHQSDDIDLCACATDILNQYGQQFYDWMKRHIEAGSSLSTVKAATLSLTFPTSSCVNSRFLPETMSVIQAILEKQYKTYREVSYRLWIVLDLVAKLENIYPAATLHDCDDGGDGNVVRLDATGLGAIQMQSDEIPLPPQVSSSSGDPNTPVEPGVIKVENETNTKSRNVKAPKADNKITRPKKPK